MNPNCTPAARITKSDSGGISTGPVRRSMRPSSRTVMPMVSVRSMS